MYLVLRGHLSKFILQTLDYANFYQIHSADLGFCGLFLRSVSSTRSLGSMKFTWPYHICLILDLSFLKNFYSSVHTLSGSPVKNSIWINILNFFQSWQWEDPHHTSLQCSYIYIRRHRIFHKKYVIWVIFFSYNFTL